MSLLKDLFVFLLGALSLLYLLNPTAGIIGTKSTVAYTSIH